MSEVQDMVNIIRLGAEGSYFLIKGSVQLVFLLLQQYKKMQRAGILSVGEVKDFENFVKATEGNYQLLNVPTEKAEELAEMKQDFSVMQISYTVLPDLNVGDGMTTIAYAVSDTLQVENWYRQFCLDHLIGGELSYAKLQQLTEGQVSIVNIPWKEDSLGVEFASEGKENEVDKGLAEKEKSGEKIVSGKEKKTTGEILQEEQNVLKERMQTRKNSIERLKADFDKLHINYTILPDLNVGDGNIQVAFANADAPQLRIWFENFQTDHIAEGQMADMTVNEYLETGKTNETQYAQSQYESIQKILENAEIGRKGPDHKNRFKNFEERVYSEDFFKELERRAVMGKPAATIETMDSVKYKQAVNHPGAMIITIDGGNMSSGRDDNGNYIVRIPNTKGQEYLPIQPDDLYLHSNGKTYIAVLQKDQSYPIIGRHGDSLGKRKGSDLYTHWDYKDKSEGMRIGKSMGAIKGKKLPSPRL